jgi:hypothetical protein
MLMMPSRFHMQLHPLNKLLITSVNLVPEPMSDVRSALPFGHKLRILSWCLRSHRHHVI